MFEMDMDAIGQAYGQLVLLGCGWVFVAFGVVALVLSVIRLTSGANNVARRRGWPFVVVMGVAFAWTAIASTPTNEWKRLVGETLRQLPSLVTFAQPEVPAAAEGRSVAVPALTNDLSLVAFEHTVSQDVARIVWTNSAALPAHPSIDVAFAGTLERPDWTFFANVYVGRYRDRADLVFTTNALPAGAARQGFYRFGPWLDSDGDGLSDFEEAYGLGTDPCRADTDGDGYADGFEVVNGMDPTVSADGFLFSGRSAEWYALNYGDELSVVTNSLGEVSVVPADDSWSNLFYTVTLSCLLDYGELFPVSIDGGCGAHPHGASLSLAEGIDATVPLLVGPRYGFTSPGNDLYTLIADTLDAEVSDDADNWFRRTVCRPFRLKLRDIEPPDDAPRCPAGHVHERHFAYEIEPPVDGTLSLHDTGCVTVDSAARTLSVGWRAGIHKGSSQIVREYGSHGNYVYGGGIVGEIDADLCIRTLPGAPSCVCGWPHYCPSCFGTTPDWYAWTFPDVFVTVTNAEGTVTAEFAEGVNSNTCVWVDVTVSDDHARVSVSTDEQATPGCYSVMARRGDTLRLPLLVGVPYVISSTGTIASVVPESSSVRVTALSDGTWSAECPLEFGLLRLREEESPCEEGHVHSRRYRLVPSVSGLDGRVSFADTHCVGVTSDVEFVISCDGSPSSACGHDGCLSGTFSYSGYAKPFSLSAELCVCDGFRAPMCPCGAATVCDGCSGTTVGWYNTHCAGVLVASTNLSGEVEFNWIGDESAYYWVEFVACRDTGVSVVADGPTNLGDLRLYASAGVTNRVPLLIGPSWTMSSESFVQITSVSDPGVRAQPNADGSWTIVWAVSFGVEEFPVATVSDVSCGWRSFRMSVSPAGRLNGRYSWSPSTCCRIGGEDPLFWMEGCDICSCDGCEATGSYTYEGWSVPVTGGRCACAGDVLPGPDWHETEGPHAAGVRTLFSSSAVIFEDAYENMPGIWADRRSTRTTLVVEADGGPDGGTLSVSALNFDKLAMTGGCGLPSGTVSVPAGMTVRYEVEYEGIAPSGAADDIIIRAEFVEAGTAVPLVSEDILTSVKVELEAVYEAPENSCAHRHVYGVGEKVRFATSPQDGRVVFSAEKFDSGDIQTFYDTFANPLMIDEAASNIYVCPITSDAMPNVTVAFGGVAYRPRMSVVEPQYVICKNASWDGVCYPSGKCGPATLTTENFIGPMHVSYRGIKVGEIPCSDVIPATGYFNAHSYEGPTSHDLNAGAGYTTRIQAGNRWCEDNAGRDISKPYENWSEGRMAWKIPIGWFRLRSDMDEFGRVVAPETALFASPGSRGLIMGNQDDFYTQTFSIDAQGISYVDKFSQVISRTRTCTVTLNGKVLQRWHPW